MLSFGFSTEEAVTTQRTTEAITSGNCTDGIPKSPHSHGERRKEEYEESVPWSGGKWTDHVLTYSD